ncbi:VWA domain-containing protein [Kangiella sp. TOML190]|uniref:VWA domain-containing protein n=1 Tax=Kangiella sp. TOML190 TaxID=2931351 RepID=UPI00204064A4|nr:VWA domain-containing protein [Kangiella sp. TOML190]
MFEWINSITQVHFIRPWAWLLLLPAILLFIWQQQSSSRQTNWANLIDEHLLAWIMPHTENKSFNKLRNSLLFIFWLLAVMAISGPSWQKLPQPIYSSEQANVIVLDLSTSMDADDIKPTRLQRAKFKLTDLLDKTQEGNSALVVYAGDAFTLSPLTSDEKTIENLIGPLATDLMPIKGSQPQKGIQKAIELLNNAEQVSGNIFWITDGAEANQLATIAEDLAATNFQLKILAVGTEEGAPIRMAGGRFLKDRSGNIVVPKLNYAQLAQFANQHAVSLTALSSDNQDIEVLTRSYRNPLDKDFQKEDIFADRWHDSGYWLVLLLLPIALFSFKHKNIVASLLVSAVLFITPNSGVSASVADKLFLNKDQQAKKHFNSGEYDKAKQTFENSDWKAISAYREGDYATAISSYNHAETANQHYNMGNALALNEQYQEAIDAYNTALELDKNHADAKYNKKIIEDLLEQQQEQQNQNEQDQQDQEKQQEQQDKQNQQEQNQDSEQEQQQQEQQQEQQDKKTEQEKQQEMSEEEKDQALEQLLKRISDDPGRLIRNKMKLEYNRRGYRSQPSKTW